MISVYLLLDCMRRVGHGYWRNMCSDYIPNSGRLLFKKIKEFIHFGYAL